MARTVFLEFLAEEEALNLLHRGRVRHPLRRAGGLATLSLLVAALMAWTPGITAGWNQSSAEATLWQLTNGDRVNNGVRPIQQNSTLVSIARWRSKDMIVNNYFSHNIPACGGCLVFHYYDTNGLSYAWAGENIGWNSGYSDPRLGGRHQQPVHGLLRAPLEHPEPGMGLWRHRRLWRR
jgi:uncharacterized protein YkwD